MYQNVLALLFAAVLLGGGAAGKQTVPKEKSGQETKSSSYRRYIISKQDHQPFFDWWPFLCLILCNAEILVNLHDAFPTDLN